MKVLLVLIATSVATNTSVPASVTLDSFSKCIAAGQMANEIAHSMKGIKVKWKCESET